MSIGCWLALAGERARLRLEALQELTDRGSLAELNHLAQADAGSWEGGIMTDGIHQLLGLAPRHLEGLCVDVHECLRDVCLPMIASWMTGTVSSGRGWVCWKGSRVLFESVQ